MFVTKCKVKTELLEEILSNRIKVPDNLKDGNQICTSYMKTVTQEKKIMWNKLDSEIGTTNAMYERNIYLLKLSCWNVFISVFAFSSWCQKTRSQKDTSFALSLLSQPGDFHCCINFPSPHIRPQLLPGILPVLHPVSPLDSLSLSLPFSHTLSFWMC